MRILILAAVGFLIGFIWGARTREALPGATETDYSGGVLTVKVKTVEALKQGFLAMFQ